MTNAEIAAELTEDDGSWFTRESIDAIRAVCRFALRSDERYFNCPGCRDRFKDIEIPRDHEPDCPVPVAAALLDVVGKEDDNG